MIHTSPSSMKPNITGLNHTGFGPVFEDAVSGRAAAADAALVFLSLAMGRSVAVAPLWATLRTSKPPRTIESMTDEPADTEPPARLRPRRRRRVSVVGVLGESLITAGVLVLMFIGWQQWFNNIVVSGDTRSQASTLEQQFQKKAEASPTPVPSGATPTTPPVTAKATGTEQFGVLYVPRFGADYKVPIAAGHHDGRHPRQG